MRLRNAPDNRACMCRAMLKKCRRLNLLRMTVIAGAFFVSLPAAYAEDLDGTAREEGSASAVEHTIMSPACSTFIRTAPASPAAT